MREEKRKLKNSHLIIIGVILMLIGVTILSSNYILKLKNEVFTDALIMIYNDKGEVVNEILNDVPEVDVVNDIPNAPKAKKIDYSKYLGVLEIPKISLKSGFYDLDSKYNNIEKNVTLSLGSRMPDVENGNLILMAHSGNAYIAYFAYLYKLKVNDKMYVTYNNIKYEYELVDIYDVEKTGTVEIKRNYSKKTLTLITCTKDSDTKQTVYIAEMVE